MREYLLGGVEVQVFHIDLAREPLRNDWLDDEEHARAQRFASDALRDRFTASHCALRRVLGNATGVAPHAVMLSRDTFGKPHLAGQPDVHFNLSHSDMHALIAVAAQPVGIDLERWIASPTDALAAEILHPAEMRVWHSLAQDRRSQHLTDLWSGKEAILKAAATGLRIPPISFEHAAHVSLAFDGRTFKVECCELAAPDGFSAALALVGSD